MRAVRLGKRSYAIEGAALAADCSMELAFSLLRLAGRCFCPRTIQWYQLQRHAISALGVRTLNIVAVKAGDCCPGATKDNKDNDRRSYKIRLGSVKLLQRSQHIERRCAD
jgi:hypothetical protein